jgi:transposase
MRGAFARALRKVPRRKRVYVDETGATTHMTRTHGRAPPGVRVVEAVPHADWEVTSLVGAVRLGGIACAMALAGATDGAAFQAFLEQSLCPTLHKGDVVLMDRLGAHRGPDVCRAIEGVGARLLYLPPYSPDLNPIEPMWSKVKEHLRAAKARTHDALIGAMGDALRSVTAADARGYFDHCGFG